MAVTITNIVNVNSTAVFTASGNVAVTDIVIFNTDPDADSHFHWKLNLVPNSASVTVNNVLFNSGGGGALTVPILPGSSIHVNTVSGMVANKWLLANGDKFYIDLDAASNSSGAWSGSPATVPVNVFVNYMSL
jgi:hypothetical protein